MQIYRACHKSVVPVSRIVPPTQTSPLCLFSGPRSSSRHALRCSVRAGVTAESSFELHHDFEQRTLLPRWSVCEIIWDGADQGSRVKLRFRGPKHALLLRRRTALDHPAALPLARSSRRPSFPYDALLRHTHTTRRPSGDTESSFTGLKHTMAAPGTSASTSSGSSANLQYACESCLLVFPGKFLGWVRGGGREEGRSPLVCCREQACKDQRQSRATWSRW